MHTLFIVLQKLLKSLCTIVFLYIEIYNCIETNARHVALISTFIIVIITYVAYIVSYILLLIIMFFL